MRFLIYDTASGQIKRFGSCPDSDIDKQAQPGESVMITDSLVDTDRYKIVDGSIVESDSRVHIDRAWMTLRNYRNRMLNETDWTQTVDNPMDPALKARFAQYRQALRDITTGLSDPSAVEWPPYPG